MNESNAIPALRRTLREHRRNLPAAQRITGAETLAANLLALPFFPSSGYVAGYWAMDGEIGLHVFQLKLPPGLVYCLPVLYDGALRFAPWRTGDALTTNRFGIPEPDVTHSAALEPRQMSLVVMPLVGFDDAGNRLGMGGGWYDRSFAIRSSSMSPPWLVGAAFESQRTRLPPPQPWDVRPDAICTESSTLIPESQ